MKKWGRLNPFIWRSFPCPSRGAAPLVRSAYHNSSSSWQLAIETKEEFEHAKIALDRRNPEAQATFILSLVRAPNGIGSYVHAFIAAADPPAAAGIVRDEIAFLREGEREYDYRHRQGFGFVSRIDRVLDMVAILIRRVRRLSKHSRFSSKTIKKLRQLP